MTDIYRQPTSRWEPLRPHEIQRSFFTSEKRFNVVAAGRRCLAKGTLVATPTGPQPIEQLQVGDLVIGYDNDKPQITSIEKIYKNGVQTVYDAGTKDRKYLTATPIHKLWTVQNERTEISNIGSKGISIKRCLVENLILGGSVSAVLTYDLGVLLCNGFSKVDRFKIPYFLEWSHDRKAHEKLADWDVVNTWEKEACFAFLAGVLDTKGLIYQKRKKQIIITLSMLSKSVIETCANIIFKYFQIKPVISMKNEVRYAFSIIDLEHTGRIVKTLLPYFKNKLSVDVDRIKMHTRFSDVICFTEKVLAGNAETYDIQVANSSNLYVLHDGGIVTSNSGKTELAKRKVVLAALKRSYYGHGPYNNGRFFFAAPTRDQAKAIYWEDLKELVPKHYKVKIEETSLTIFLKNKTIIRVVGMDKPERFEGQPWDGGVLDEYANMKEEAWNLHVRPSLSDRHGWCDIISVPEGRNHYYETYKKAASGKNKEMAAFTWPSSDILPASEIEQAKYDLDPLSFQQEYEASFINFSGRAYYPFSEFDHCKTLKYDPKLPLIFCFDFNVAPGVAAVCQEQYLPGVFEKIPDPKRFGVGVNALANALKEGETAFIRIPAVGTGVIGEVYIPNNSNTRIVCNKLIYDWGEHQGDVCLYGDATGGARGSAKLDGSDWDIIFSVLSNHYGDNLQLCVPKANPSERSRVNAVNARLKTMTSAVRMMVDPARAPHVVKDLEGVRLLDGGSGEINKKIDVKLSHISDALGYYLVKEFPVIEKAIGAMSISGLY